MKLEESDREFLKAMIPVFVMILSIIIMEIIYKLLT